MAPPANQIDLTPSASRKTRAEVEQRRRDREATGFKRLREAIQGIVPNNGSRFERADILEQAATLLQAMWEEKKNGDKGKNGKEKEVSPVLKSSSFPSTPSPRSSFLSPSSSTPLSSSFLPQSSILTPPSPPSFTGKDNENEKENENKQPQGSDFSFFSNLLLNQIFLSNFAQALSSTPNEVVAENSGRKRKTEDKFESQPDQKKIWRPHH